MISKYNEPIYKKENGTYVMRHPLTGEVNYWCGMPDDLDGCHKEVEEYLAKNPKALIPEPKVEVKELKQEKPSVESLLARLKTIESEQMAIKNELERLK
jgi:hypothetical protein